MLVAKPEYGHLIDMRPLLVILATILAGSAVPSVASPDRPPYLCGGPDIPRPVDDEPAPSASMLAGTYRCTEDGITVTLRLDADGRFEERMEGETGRATGDGAVPQEPSTLSGRWQVEGWSLRLFQPPMAAPFARRARVADARGHALIIPFGIAGAVVRRVPAR